MLSGALILLWSKLIDLYIKKPGSLLYQARYYLDLCDPWPGVWFRLRPAVDPVLRLQLRPREGPEDEAGEGGDQQAGHAGDRVGDQPGREAPSQPTLLEQQSRFLSASLKV